jgi:hypothetical protein
MARKPKSQTQIEFDYIKSNFFRVIRADGAFGGISPTGAIHMAVYSERQAIPTKTVHHLQGTQLGPELRERRQGRTAIVREVEADIVLELPQAIVLRDWLDEKIKSLNAMATPTANSSNGKGNKSK